MFRIQHLVVKGRAVTMGNRFNSCAILIAVGLTACAGQSEAFIVDDSGLGGRLNNILLSSSQLEIFYTPIERMGPVPFTRAELEESEFVWVKINCSGGCGVDLPVLSQVIASNEFTRYPCRGVFTTLLRVSTSPNEIIDIYVDGSGYCISFDGEEYVSRFSLNEGLISGFPYQDVQSLEFRERSWTLPE